MQITHLEKQEAEPIDEATQTALDKAEGEIERGEFVTLAQARIIVEIATKHGKKNQQEALLS